MQKRRSSARSQLLKLAEKNAQLCLLDGFGKKVFLRSRLLFHWRLFKQQACRGFWFLNGDGWWFGGFDCIGVFVIRVVFRVVFWLSDLIVYTFEKAAWLALLVLSFQFIIWVVIRMINGVVGGAKAREKRLFWGGRGRRGKMLCGHLGICKMWWLNSYRI